MEKDNKDEKEVKEVKMVDSYMSGLKTGIGIAGTICTVVVGLLVAAAKLKE